MNDERNYAKWEKEEIVKQIVQIFSLPNGRISIREDTRIDSLGLGSLEYISAIVQIEDIFGIRFDEEHLKLAAFENIECIIKYVIDEEDKRIASL